MTFIQLLSKNRSKSFKISLVIGFTVLVFTSCQNRNAILNGKFTTSEILRIKTNNLLSFDSATSPTIKLFSDSSSTGYGQPIVLKDTACIFFSGTPMSQGGVLMANQFEIIFGGAKTTYTAYIGVTNSGIPAVTQSTGVPFDYRASYYLGGYGVAEGKGAGVQVSVAPWSPTGR